jgi:hypothetical protein
MAQADTPSTSHKPHEEQVEKQEHTSTTDKPAQAVDRRALTKLAIAVPSGVALSAKWGAPSVLSLSVRQALAASPAPEPTPPAASATSQPSVDVSKAINPLTSRILLTGSIEIVNESGDTPTEVEVTSYTDTVEERIGSTWRTIMSYSPGVGAGLSTTPTLVGAVIAAPLGSKLTVSYTIDLSLDGRIIDTRATSVRNTIRLTLKDRSNKVFNATDSVTIR